MSEGATMAVEWTDFPLVQNYINRKALQLSQKHIVEVLEARFGTIPEDLAALVRTIMEEKELDALLTYAAKCPSIISFRERITQENPSPN
jgi:hypothetical protein